MSKHPLELLHHYTSGAIERGEAEPIVELRRYRVTWTIDIDAESFQAAAERALQIQRDPNSTATVFEVQRSDAISMTIDLNQE